jgi:glycosyltransferase involved in cell wall biosynthesis
VATEARILAASGAQVTVIAPGTEPGDRSSPELLVQRVGGGELFGWPGIMARLDEHPARVLRLPPWLARARAAIARSGADELVAHWVVPSVFPLTLGLPLPADAITAVSHGSDVRLLVRSPPALRAHLVRGIARRVGRWRFVSETLHEELAAALDPVTARAVARIAVVAPPALDLPDVALRARALRASVPETALYLVAARLVPAKRVDACLAWVARNVSHAPDDRLTRLVVLGEGPERETLVQQARGLASPRLRVDLLGTRERAETLAWIAAADAVLHASREEGLSTVVREAAHYGTDVVTVG